MLFWSKQEYQFNTEAIRTPLFQTFSMESNIMKGEHDDKKQDKLKDLIRKAKAISRDAAIAGLIYVSVFMPLNKNLNGKQIPMPIRSNAPIFLSIHKNSATHVITETSLNWCGYAVETNFNDPKSEIAHVHGDFKVIKAQPSLLPRFSSEWIGIGGIGDKSLIQIGISANSSFAGSGYFAWYELLPKYEQYIPMKIYPKDHIIANIKLVDKKTNTWEMNMSDLTEGECFSKTVTYKSAMLSAEWILEKPEITFHLFGITAPMITPLEYFNDASFGNFPLLNSNYAVINGKWRSINEANYVKIDMVTESGKIIASPSKLSEDGTFFEVKRNKIDDKPIIIIENSDKTHKPATQ
jgi:hypothetical protein